MDLTLYEITADRQRAIEQLADEPDRDKAMQILESIEGALVEKASSVALFLRTLDAGEKALVAEIERLENRRSQLAAKHKRLSEYLEFNLRKAGITKVDGNPLVTIGFRKNPPKVDVLCEAQIPPEFWTQPEPPAPRLDKEAIKRAIKAGQDVPGVQLTQSERLVIE